MDSLWHVGLSNAVLVLPIASVAATVSAWGRRPALAHGLWLLVLLKLVTPPLLSLPVPRLLPQEASPAHVQTPLTYADSRAEGARLETNDREALTRGGSTPGRLENGNQGADQVVSPHVEADRAGAPLAEDRPLPAIAATSIPVTDPEEVGTNWLSSLLLTLWQCGAVLWLVLSVVRIRQFRRLLRHARPASEELQSKARDLAGRLGLRNCPPVRLVPGPVSPMLWGLSGQAVLLLPAELLDRLDEEQRATLLAHELAHYRRRDHWVRLLELLVTGLYWWHPVVWWARHGLRDAEEQCCDAWVVWALPTAARAYADALVETVDFLSETRLALPPAASGIGHVRILKRRLTMILKGMPSRKLSLVGTLGILVLGLLLLPWVADWALADEPPAPGPGPQTLRVMQPPQGPAAEVGTENVQYRALQALVDMQTPDDVRKEKAAEMEKATTEFVKSLTELEKMRAQLRAAEIRMAESQKRLNFLTTGDGDRFYLTRPAGQPGAKVMVEDIYNILANQLKVKEAQAAEAEAKYLQAKATFARNNELAARGAITADEVALAETDLKVAAARLKEKTAEVDAARTRMNFAKTFAPMSAIAPPPVPSPGGPNVIAIRSAPLPVPGVPSVIGIHTGTETRAVEAGKLLAGPNESDLRLRELEKKMGELLKEVEHLRQDLKRQPPAKRDPLQVPPPPAQ